MFDEMCRRLYWWVADRLYELEAWLVAHMSPEQRATMERMGETMRELGHRG